MTHLTHVQIAAAKSNDLEAVSSVIRETESLVSARARHYAGSAMENGNTLADDLTQTGRIAVWQCISKFDGDTPQAFMAYIDRHVSAAMLDALRAETRPGVTARAAKDFEAALVLAAGDPYEAERVAISPAMGDRKMSPEHAYAARLSWLGLDYLDRPVSGEDGQPLTLAEKVERETGTPAELITAADIASHRRTVIRDQVHKTLGALSERQRHVLKAGFGIAPVAIYQPGADDDELAADMGATRYQVQQARTKGSKRFAELYRAGARAW
ncbi:sigma-70 family RNA polymerase sigma factor [Streptomyces sp. CB02115]|uniref:sigma-70 family RNA polymerase sigma factor n=1 Tax=Streptomyces sp. CB02115 TaxID=1703939 RepID=UPI000939702B|nr:sigma-70 family RNA polymerase sigma factor [Streptomyces sp. CB02115]